jgi:hypothetical protein
MKTPFACTVALAAVLAAGGVQAGPVFDSGEGLDLSDVEPVEMDLVRRADGTLMTRESFPQPDGSRVTRMTIREPAAAAAPSASVELTQAQRRLIWHTVAVPARADAGNVQPEPAEFPVVREHIEAVPGQKPYRVGSHMPVPSSLQPLPDAVTLAVPSVQDHLYTVIDERVLLVDPSTKTVVAEVLR